MCDFFGVACLREEIPRLCCPSSGVDMFKNIWYNIYDDDICIQYSIDVFCIIDISWIRLNCERNVI